MEPSEPRFVPSEDILATRPAPPGSLGKLLGLWVHGSLAGLGKRTIAIVGSRAPSEAGRRLARRTAERLAGCDVCVLSGLALGIDGAAHEGALDAHAPTIGVLGGGHEHFFPRRNRGLAQRMITEGGAVVSPFPPGQPAYPSQFLQRNGVVAALADAVVVVEAAARSGAANTCSWAADRSIPVFAFPGDVDRPKVAGCLALIRDGATLVRSADDILNDLGIPVAPILPLLSNASAPDDELAQRILARLAAGETSFEILLAAAGAPVPDVLAKLVQLELAGRVERHAGQCYALRTRSP